jgi:uncharacterized delta-60 repeat protein
MSLIFPRFLRIIACTILLTPALVRSLADVSSSGFDAWVNGFANPIAIQPDAKILVGGRFSAVNGVPRKGLARLDSSGALDQTFNPQIDLGVNFDYTVSSLTVQPDGKIIVGGLFTNMNGIACKGLVRIGSDGASDTNFVSPVASPTRVILQPDGKIIVNARITNHPTIGRVMPDGSLDMAFMANISDPNVLGLGAIALQPDGKILVGGATVLKRLNVDGTLDVSFEPSLNMGSLQSSGIQPGGRIIAGVGLDEGNGYMETMIGLNLDGTADPGFTAPTNSNLHLIAIQPDGKLLAASTPLPGPPLASLVRLNADGALDSSFSSTIHYFGLPVLQSDGKILMVCNAHEIIRINADGTLDPLVQIKGMALAPDGALQFVVDRPNVTNFTILATSQFPFFWVGDWVQLGAAIQRGSNTFEFRDPATTDSNARFYWIVPRTLAP